MFNKKTYRISKKINKIKINKKSLINVSIMHLIKNKKLIFFKKLIFIKKINFFNLKNRNVCSFTGKYKSIFNLLKLSRHSIRKFADTSSLANFSKLSW